MVERQSFLFTYYLIISRLRFLNYWIKYKFCNLSYACIDSIYLSSYYATAYLQSVICGSLSASAISSAKCNIKSPLPDLDRSRVDSGMRKEMQIGRQVKKRGKLVLSEVHRHKIVKKRKWEFMEI